MSDLARFNPSVSVTDAEIVAQSYLQRVPLVYREQLRQPFVYLAQQEEAGSIQQLVNAAIDRQEVRLYRWIRELQPEIDELQRRQDALENRVKKLEHRQLACLPTAYEPASSGDDQPPSNIQLLSIILLLAAALGLLWGNAHREAQIIQLERIQLERGLRHD